MGLCLGYQALPEDSQFFRQLLVDRRLGVLYSHLFLSGGGPFSSWTIYIDDIADLLDDLAQSRELFENREQTEGTARALYELVNQSIRKYPGLENRQVYLDKTHG